MHRLNAQDNVCCLQVLSAYGHEPVATTSLLAYLCCCELHSSLPELTDWLAVMGTFGDLGSSVKWQPPLPDMAATLKRHGKQKCTQAVSLINAREYPYPLLYAPARPIYAEPLWQAGAVAHQVRRHASEHSCCLSGRAVCMGWIYICHLLEAAHVLLAPGRIRLCTGSTTSSLHNTSMLKCLHEHMPG